MQLLGIELYTRKNKLLLAAKCIRSAFRILSSVSTPTSIPPHFHIAIIRFLAAAQAASFSSSDAGAEKGDVRENTIKLILGEEVNFIYSTLASYYASSSSPASAEEYNQLYLSQHSTSFPHRLAFAQSLVLTKAGTDEVKEEAIQLCAQVGVGCDVEVSRSSITRAAANEALAFISSLSSPSVSADTAEESAAVAAFKQSVSSLFPLDNQLMDSFSMERCKERAEALTAVY